MEILLSGLPGKMASEVAMVLCANNISTLSLALTGEELDGQTYKIADSSFHLVGPTTRSSAIKSLKNRSDIIVVDFTQPHVALQNIEFYCKENLNFVMGTTGFDRTKAQAMISESNISAVIAPNMAVQLVVLQSILENAANYFPNAFANYSLQVVESHQQTKLDKSGTGVLFSSYFQKLGAKLNNDNFISIRDPNTQRQMGIPESSLNGHGYHTYTLLSNDNSNEIALTHNVRGRKIYAAGTLVAIKYLAEKIKSGIKGKTFSMLDVISNN